MSAIHSLTVVSTTGRTLYGYPAARSLALWNTHRVLLAEEIAPDLCRYNGTVNTLDNGELWYVFEGATQPGNWNEAVLPVFDLSSRTSVKQNITIINQVSIAQSGINELTADYPGLLANASTAVTQTTTASIRSSLGVASANMDTQLAGIRAKTDLIGTIRALIRW